MQVFVYGTLKRGHCNNYLLRGACCHGAAVTVGRWHMLDGGFPVVLQPHQDHDTQPGHVVGELYTVDRETVARLDRLESNGRMYTRREVTVRLASGLKTRAWMYVGNEDFWRHYWQHRAARGFIYSCDGQLSWPARERLPYRSAHHEEQRDA